LGDATGVANWPLNYVTTDSGAMVTDKEFVSCFISVSGHVRSLRGHARL